MFCEAKQYARKPKKTDRIQRFVIFLKKYFVLQKLCTNFGGRNKKRLTPDEKHVEWPDASNHKITA